jgi:hypothetical protein
MLCTADVENCSKRKQHSSIFANIIIVSCYQRGSSKYCCVHVGVTIIHLSLGFVRAPLQWHLHYSDVMLVCKLVRVHCETVRVVQVIMYVTSRFA